MRPAKVEVKRSRVQGRGVFARRDLAPGEKVIEYEGERITPAEAEKRYDDEAMARHHTFLFTIDRHTVIDAVHRGNEARFINHSCDPNCVAAIDDGHIWIYAIKPIAAGAELFYDYWYSTDSHYTMEDLRRLYPCRCGSPKCRGTLAAPRRPPRKKKKKASPRAGAKKQRSRPRAKAA